uniref:RxLR effector candidate protein n=1 Tax=Hyaloperonospora arabidopsidis (strain Emoy2) TaxID=559515 RepID=M4BGU9_HYAAE|nr:RxLR effector candidate protein [Hyaloperonospora arabidopsidis Emoy2]
MSMASFLCTRHKVTLKIILKRELIDCAPSQEVPMLSIHRSRRFGGGFEIELGEGVHPVWMLPVSGKDVRNLRFGLVYGPRRKRIRLCAPNVATHDRWAMLLEVAVAKAATERPTFPLWPYPGPSPSFSALEASCFSDDFGFSDNDGTDVIKGGDCRYRLLHVTQRTPSSSSSSSSSNSRRFVDPLSPPRDERQDVSAYETKSHTCTQIRRVNLACQPSQDSFKSHFRPERGFKNRWRG